MTDKVDPEKRMEAVWCVDSETSERVLVDRETNKIVAKKNDKGETVWIV